MKINKAIILLLISLSVYASECKLVDQENYSYLNGTMYLEITSNGVKTAIKENINFYKKSNIKNVYMDSAFAAFDVLQIDGKMVYMNHYSPNGRAYQIWKCK